MHGEETQFWILLVPEVVPPLKLEAALQSCASSIECQKELNAELRFKQQIQLVCVRGYGFYHALRRFGIKANTWV